MNMLEKYNSLPDGKKSKIRRAYVALFGCKRTFHRKINGTVRLHKAEQIFFEKNLLNNLV